MIWTYQIEFEEVVCFSVGFVRPRFLFLLFVSFSFFLFG